MEQSSGGPPPPPPPPNCTLSGAFDTPNNRTGPQLTLRPDGTYIAWERFFMNADFSSTTPAECRCCEYRQYVKGHMKTRAPGQDWVTGWSEANYVEDLLPDGRGYGHRNQPQYLTDKYLPLPRATGCSYRGIDSPSVSPLGLGDEYDILLVFKATIIDVCNGNAIKSTALWTVRIVGIVA